MPSEKRKAARGIGSVILFNQYNLVLVAASIVFTLALGSPWPAIIGGGLELAWLVVGLSSRRVRRWAVGHLMERDGARGATEIAELLRTLEPAHVERLLRVQALASEIRRLAWERKLEGVLVHPGQGADQLQTPVLAFARLAALYQRLAAIVGRTNSTQIEEEIVNLGKSLSQEQDASVHFLLTHALTVAQGRLQQHEQIASSLRAVAVRMSTLEMSFDYIRSHLVMGKSETDLATELTQLIGSLNFVSEAEAAAEASMAHVPVSGARTTTAEIPGLVPVGGTPRMKRA